MVLSFESTVPRRARAALLALIRPIASLRVLALALTAALVLTQTSSALHELLVPHRVCAEHGHRIHAGQTASPRVDRPDGSQGPAARSHRAAESDHHEHCAPPARPEPGGLPLLRAVVAMLAPIGQGSAFATTRVVVHAGPAILLVAPKQSPPA